jgi:type VI secretion system protein ImpE
MGLRAQLDGGNLAEAISAGVAAVKARPGDADLRYQLFALFCFAGDRHRARKQLAALDVADRELTRVQAVYINLLASEQERTAVFHHGAAPLLPGEPPPHLERRQAALAAAGRGEPARAAELVAEAIDLQPEIAGQVNDAPLTSLRDMDDYLGSLLEVFAGGRYLWLPLEHIAKLEVAPPRHLLDLLWLPAELTDHAGAISSIHLPVLYEGSAHGGDPRCATGRLTEWASDGGELWRGRGQRVLGWAAPGGDLTELPLLELRSLALSVLR